PGVSRGYRSARTSRPLLHSREALLSPSTRSARAGGRELPDPGQWLLRLVALVVGVVAGVLAMSLVAQGLAAGAVRSALSSVDVEIIVPEANDLPELEQRSVVYGPDGTPLATLHEAINRREVALEEVPDHVWQALVTAEDRKFFEHKGYDIEGI